MTNKRAFKSALWCTKYMPALMAVTMFLHVLALNLGYRGLWAENILIVLFAIGALAADIAYGFCWLHRSLIIYALAVYLCIGFERSMGFGELLPVFHFIMAAIGGFLLGTLIIKHTQYDRHCTRANNIDCSRDRDDLQ